ncbi:AAA domain-containing protein [uncultured Psychrosphaera sp.]|uniref:AAA domain-containing protein n=1 Tax=uncultured Psychrosphaera sp. TaxID=1403522 RepID=UPI00261C2530|nr:AAA domain-containing protein [uncultured Psychrosphaera sp.]
MKHSAKLMSALRENNLFKLANEAFIGDQSYPLEAFSEHSQTNVDLKYEESFSRVTGKSIVAMVSLKGRTKYSVRLIAIPMRLHSNHALAGNFLFAPNIQRQPEVNHDLFSSDEHQPEICLGSSNDFHERLLDIKPIIPTDDWSTWFTYAIDMFNTISDVSLINMASAFQSVLPQSRLVITLHTLANGDAGGAIEQLYESVLSAPEQALSKTCFARIDDVFFGRYQTDFKVPNYISEVGYWSPTYLLGHMDELKDKNKEDLSNRELFALDNTQRAVIMALAETELSDVLAVNGPPGSGKTAMLKAVVANQWVKAAIDGEDCPIVIGVGGTNQSVKNIIGAFPKVMHPTATTDSPSVVQCMKRWINGPQNYGSFLPSNYELKGDEKKNKPPMSQEDINDKAVIQSNNEQSPGTFHWLGDNAIASDFKSLPIQKNTYIRCAQVYFDKLFQEKVAKALYDGAAEPKPYEMKNVKEIVDLLQSELLVMKDTMVNSKTSLLNKIETLQNSYSTLDDAILGERENEFNLLDELTNTKESINYYLEYLSLSVGNREQRQKVIARVCREHLLDQFDVRNDLIGMTDKDKTHFFQVISDNEVTLYPQAIHLIIEAIIDTQYRFRMFHLAARYWEGRYLLACEEKILITRNKTNVELGLRRLCMLTPCLVSTTKSAPNLFSYRSPPGVNIGSFWLGLADLMIIDEAGQADIRDCLPLLALAKRAIAVGDIDQIPPVVSDEDITGLQEHQHIHLQQFYDGHKLKTPDAAYAYLFANKYLPNAGGSILHVLRNGSRFSIKQPGLMLRGHYRCQQIISQFCNEMVYDNQIFINGNLIDKKGVIPPLSFVESSGKTYQENNASRANAAEVDMVVDWIIKRWPDVQKHYNASIDGKWLADLIAVVSPFKLQARRILEALKKALPKERADSISLCETDANNFTCGTIDSLQGAERPIILYSGAKGANDGGSTHFDKTPHVLNVAVSRAKESFVAFVCPATYGIGTSKEPARTLEGKVTSSMKYLGYYMHKVGAKRLFPKNLVIIEADGKKKALSEALGPDYKVVATSGAFLDNRLGAPSKENQYRPAYRWAGEDDEKRRQTKEKIESILDEITDPAFEDIFLATDDDFMGETIAWQLMKLYARKHADNPINFKRVRLRGMDKVTVNEAFDVPVTLDFNRVHAEIARDIADNVGSSLMTKAMKDQDPLTDSEFITEGLKRNLISPVEGNRKVTFGRVQRASIELLYRYTQHQIAALDNNASLGVRVTANGMDIEGVLSRPEGLEKPLPPLADVSNIVWKQSSGIVDEYIKLPVPEANTLGVLKYAFTYYDIPVAEAYDSLTALYEGVVKND